MLYGIRLFDILSKVIKFYMSYSNPLFRLSNFSCIVWFPLVNFLIDKSSALLFASRK